MRIIDCIQYSPEWWEARNGIPSASNFDRIITAKQGKLSAGADGYIAELIADRICPTPPFFTERGGHTAAMRNGTNTEPEARRFYELERRCDVAQVGLCITDCGRFCASPDGLIGSDGCLELKCPEPRTQILYLMDGTLPSEYLQQVHGQLAVTGRAWVDFLSYCAGLPPLLLRVEADDFTLKLKAALEEFWLRYDAACWKILGKHALIERSAAA